MQKRRKGKMTITKRKRRRGVEKNSPGGPEQQIQVSRAERTHRTQVPLQSVLRTRLSHVGALGLMHWLGVGWEWDPTGADLPRASWGNRT